MMFNWLLMAIVTFINFKLNFYEHMERKSDLIKCNWDVTPSSPCKTQV